MLRNHYAYQVAAMHDILQNKREIRKESAPRVAWREHASIWTLLNQCKLGCGERETKQKASKKEHIDNLLKSVEY